MSLIRFNTTIALALASLAPLTVAAPAIDDRTIGEFKEYVSEKVPNLSDAQLASIAEAVDKDGDGIVTDQEFAGRMAAIQTVLSGGGPPPRGSGEAPSGPAPAGASDYLSGTPVDIPALTSAAAIPVLLITNDEIAEAWIPYAEWKTRGGKATRIITVQRIAQEYEADGIQEKIRLCVRDHIENQGTRWVVLGGDCLPGCNGLVPGGHTTVHAQERKGIPTDIVYLSATNWDADGDGVCGEWQDDREAISYPDGSVGLGRVPVRSAADVVAFTEKVIAYETSYPAQDFARQMIYTCTEKMAYPKVRKSWDAHLSEAWDGGEMGRFFADETPWDADGSPGSHPLSPDNLVALINAEGTGKLHIHGHGVLTQWILETSSFKAGHVEELSNAAAYPLITTVSCNTGEYDSRKDPSIVEAMVRRPEGGSVAIFAPVRTGKMHFHEASDMRLMVSEGKLDGTTMTMTRYWLNGLGNGLTTGEAAMKALGGSKEDAEKSAAYHLCICELNLLGDPTLDMRAKDPRRPRVEVPARIALGKQKIEIQSDAPGATVCLWKGLEVYSVATADAEGKATLEVEPTTPGELLVTVGGASLNSVTAAVEVD